MIIRFPYPGEILRDYYISQSYDSNPINPATGTHYYNQHHGGMDIVPLTHAGGNFWPAPIFPVLDGKTLSASTTDIDRGLGIKVRSILDHSLINYFKKLGLIPNDYSGEVWLDHLYWHCLKVTDLDGFVDESHQVGLTGNSGYVFAGGLLVPDSEKNVPPYPGGHLHFEFSLRSPDQVFNLDKDALGRLNPELLFAYKGDEEMIGYKKMGDATTYIEVQGKLVPLADWAAFVAMGGSNDSVVELSETQWAKFTKINSVLFKSK